MISSFAQKIEEIIASSSIVVSSNIQKFFSSSEKEAYIRGTLIFIDLSSLEFSLFVNEKGSKIIFDKYRFQYMDSAKKLLFRYDNAPHHKEISTFPMHKHVKDKVIASSQSDLKEVLEEISTLIIQSIK